MDLFGSMRNPQVSKKFQIYRFANGTRDSKSPFLESRNGTKADNALLERTLKEIENSSAKLLMDYERIYKEMMVKRKQINQEISEMKGVAKGEVLAMYHKADIDLLNSAIRVIDSKAKVQSDKIKALRDERKFHIDKTKPVETTTEATTTNAAGANFNSPLIAINAGGATPTTGNARVISQPIPADAVINVDTIEQKKETEAVSIPKSPMEKYLEQEAIKVGEASEITPTETPLNAPVTVNQYDNVVVTTDATGSYNTTIGDIRNRNLSKINERLATGDKFKENYNTRLGHDFDRSLKAMIQSDNKVQHHLYIDPESGMYYLKGFTEDENGLHEFTQYDPMGLAHIGNIKFNGSKPECKLQFFEDAIPYHVLNDGIASMPEFYRNEWNKPNANQYVIDNESDIMTIRKVAGSNN